MVCEYYIFASEYILSFNHISNTLTHNTYWMRLHYTIHTEMKMGKWTTQKESYWFFVIFRYKKLQKENISRDVPYYVPPLHQPYWLISETASRWIKRDHLIRVCIKIRYLKQIYLNFLLLICKIKELEFQICFNRL